MKLLPAKSIRLVWPVGVIAAVSISVLAVQSAGARGNAGAPARQATINHTLSVGGHGEVDVAPDMARITVGVQSKGQDAREALSRNSTSLNAVVAAIEGQGVPASRIQTSDLSLWFDEQHDSYVASHNLDVRIDDVNKVGSVLDAAVAAGANTSWGVSFALKDESAARAQALQAAIADARKRANSMASALGVSVTGVVSAGEATVNVVQPPYPAAAQASAASGTNVQPGQLTISADVTVVYSFGS
jgi:uncharacterized protein YggE